VLALGPVVIAGVWWLLPMPYWGTGGQGDAWLLFFLLILIVGFALVSVAKRFSS
jgi:hypothetical protein